MSERKMMASVKEIRVVLEGLGPEILYRKMYGIQNALAMQVEDGKYHRVAVVRLGEALLATAELYKVPAEAAGRLEELAGELVEMREGRK